jgi:hypothetical protein
MNFTPYGCFVGNDEWVSSLTNGNKINAKAGIFQEKLNIIFLENLDHNYLQNWRQENGANDTMVFEGFAYLMLSLLV